MRDWGDSVPYDGKSGEARTILSGVELASTGLIRNVSTMPWRGISIGLALHKLILSAGKC